MTLLAAARGELTPQEFHVDNWTTFGTTSAECTVQSGTVLGGASASIRHNMTVTPANATNDFETRITAENDVFVRFLFRVDAVAADLGANLITICQISGPGVLHAIGVYMKRNAGGTANALQFETNTTDDGTRFEIATNTTYEVQMRLSPVNQDWYFCEVKIDNVLRFRRLVRRDPVGSTNTNLKISFGGQQAFGLNFNVNIYMAEISLNDDQGSVNNGWPGTGLTWQTMVPNGAGSNLAYTAWSNDYQNLDESPTGTSADRCAENINNDKEGWTMGTVTITTCRAIVTVWDWQRFETVAGQGSIGVKMLTWDGAEHATAQYDYDSTNTSLFATGEKGQNIVMEAQPSDGAAWDQTTIDNLECGIQLISPGPGSPEGRLYAMRAYEIDGAAGPAGELQPTPLFGWAA